MGNIFQKFVFMYIYKSMYSESCDFEALPYRSPYRDRNE